MVVDEKHQWTCIFFKRSPSKNLLHFLYFVIGLTVGLTLAIQLRGFSINLGVPIRVLTASSQPLPQPLSPPSSTFATLPQPLGGTVNMLSNVSTSNLADVRMEDGESLSPPPSMFEPPPQPLGGTVNIPSNVSTSNLASVLMEDGESLSPPPLGGAVNLHSNISSSDLADVGMEDGELFRQASMVHAKNESSSNHVPKVAFMFLTRGPIPLAPLWQKFFHGHEGMYSIYVHSDPLYVDRVANDSVFYGRRVPSKPVQWGKPSMIEAERRLLANALLDITNQRLILLSESCIPLFNFSTIYTYLTNTNESFVHSYDDPRNTGRGRYNEQMAPTVNIAQWRKGSQWFEVSREVAIAIVTDVKYFSIFTEYCSPPCYTDEHYIPTLVNILFPEDDIHRSITWVDWSKSGPHPGRFIRNDVTLEFINKVRFTGNCTYNKNTSSICVLFARKFVGDTLQPLLDLSSLLFS